VKKSYILLFIICILICNPINAIAETRYVSDMLEITMRSGKGTGYGITRMLRSGTPLEVLEIDKETGYSKVRTDNGKEGWVLSRFLMQEQAARDLLTAAEKKLAEQETDNRKLTTAMAALKDEKKTLANNLNSLEKESRSVSRELAEVRQTASKTLTINSENKDLKNQLLSLKSQLQTVEQENERLRDRTAREWFMVGAGVVLLGIIIGLIIPKIRFSKKKSTWYTF